MMQHNQRGYSHCLVKLPEGIIDMQVPDELLTMSKLALVAKPTYMQIQTQDRESIVEWSLVLLSLIVVVASFYLTM